MSSFDVNKWVSDYEFVESETFIDALADAVTDFEYNFKEEENDAY